MCVISWSFYLSSGVIFPEQFYTFLKNYMSKFSMLPVLTADEKIGRYKYFCFALSLPVAPASGIHTLAHIFLRQIDLCYLFFSSLEILTSDP